MTPDLLRPTGEIRRDNPSFTAVFVCGRNGGRSQIGQGFFNALKEDYPLVDKRYRAISFGTRPGTEVHPLVVQAMGEVGIDLTDTNEYHPKGMNDAITDNNITSVLEVINVCDDTCELPPAAVNATYRRWHVQDPNGQPIEVVREVRDQIKENVIDFLKELNGKIN